MNIRSDLECKTKYNKGATRDDLAMDRNEVKSKLSNSYKGYGIQPGLDDQGQKVARLPWELKHLSTRRKGNQPRLHQ